MNWEKFTFRCHSLGSIMTNDRSGKNMGETCIKELISIWVEQTYGRVRELNNRYVTKGLMVEEDSVTMLSRLRKKIYFKNEERLFNDYLNGLPDLFEGETIKKASRILDAKSSWDIFTFFNSKTSPVKKDYDYQLQGYMDLSGAQEGHLVYCLIDTPEVIINDEKRKLMWKMGATTEQSELYLKACEELDKAMRFDDIPMEDRMFIQVVKRDDEKIEAIHERVIECREWLTEFDMKMKPKLIAA
jgi:hypothetical protein